MKLNIYTVPFSCVCPAGKVPVYYTLRFETDKMIMVERLLEDLSDLPSNFHENIADRLIDQFGGKQTITATHHGVEIVTVREAS